MHGHPADCSHHACNVLQAAIMRHTGWQLPCIIILQGVHSQYCRRPSIGWHTCKLLLFSVLQEMATSVLWVGTMLSQTWCSSWTRPASSTPHTGYPCRGCTRPWLTWTQQLASHGVSSRSEQTLGLNQSCSPSISPTGAPHSLSDWLNTHKIWTKLLSCIPLHCIIVCICIGVVPGVMAKHMSMQQDDSACYQRVVIRHVGVGGLPPCIGQDESQLNHAATCTVRYACQLTPCCCQSCIHRRGIYLHPPY